jgi:hypothetical protein
MRAIKVDLEKSIQNLFIELMMNNVYRERSAITTNEHALIEFQSPQRERIAVRRLPPKLLLFVNVQSEDFNLVTPPDQITTHLLAPGFRATHCWRIPLNDVNDPHVDKLWTR